MRTQMRANKRIQQTTIQVSDHPESGMRIPTQAGSESWATVVDERMTGERAIELAEDLAKVHRHVRVFRGANIGRLWYGILDARREVQP